MSILTYARSDIIDADEVDGSVWVLELGPEIRPCTMAKRGVYDSLDAVARSRGRLRPR